jgi:hypothetical protein
VVTPPGGAFSPGLSADGREVTYHTFRGTARQIMVVNTDGSNPRQLTDDSTQQALNPQMSRNGLRIAYGTNPWAGDDPRAGVYVISRPDLTGEWGEPVLELPGGFLPQWSPVADELVMIGAGGNITIKPLGGPARVVIGPGDGLGLSRLGRPSWFNDGRSIFFTAFDAEGNQGLYRVAATGGVPTLLIALDEPRWSLRSQDILVRGGTAYFAFSEVESDIWVADLVEQ